jgi:hypothetical protein
MTSIQFRGVGLHETDAVNDTERGDAPAWFFWKRGEGQMRIFCESQRERTHPMQIERLIATTN